MDEGMKQMYKTIFKLDVNECQKIDEPQDIQVILPEEMIDFKDFVSRHMRVVAIDQFSNKETVQKIAEQTCAEFSKKFVEMFTQWGLLQYDGRSIGCGRRVLLHNPFPDILSLDAMIQDPSVAVERCYTKMMERMDVRDMMQPTKIMGRTDIYVLPLFAVNHIVYNGNIEV